MKKTNKLKLITIAVGLACTLGTQSAHAQSFESWVSTVFPKFSQSIISQLGQQVQDMGKAFDSLGKSLEANFAAANLQGAAVKQFQKSLIQKINASSLPPQFSQGNNSDLAGIDMQGIVNAAQNLPGRIYTKDITGDIDTIGQAQNPTQAISLMTTIDLQNRLRDSNNVIGFFDMTARDYTCASKGYRCTVLVALQEKVANQVDNLQKEVVGRGSFWLDNSQRRTPGDVQYNNTFTIGLDVKDGSSFSVDANPKQLSAFLSPAPMLAAGFNPATDKGALTPAKAAVLSDVLLGVNDFNALQNYVPAEQSQNKSTLQSKILTRFARVQLARHAIATPTSLSVIDAMNSEFKVCVVRPTLADTVGNSVPQHLTNIEQLLRCTNLSLLHLRRVQMEQSRLIAVLLSTQLDQYSLSTIDEEATSINTQESH